MPELANGRVLILDDDQDVGRTLALMARSLGFETRLTTYPAEFLALESEWQPTHIAVDLIMPELDGVEVLHLLSGRRCRAGIIITSGADHRVIDSARRAFTEGGMNVLGGLPKPFTKDQVASLLQVRQHPDGAPPGVIHGNGGVLCTEADLREALDARQIEIALQPKVHCSDRRPAGFEALARWTHHSRTIPPSEFVVLAEQSDLISSLTDQVVDQALAWLTGLPRGEACSVAINLSARLFEDHGLADRLHIAALRHGVDPTRVILEITETSAMADPSYTLAVATRLRLKGFRLSMDDFGVGYSSLVQLARFPFSEIKLDGSLVREVETSSDARKIIMAVIGLGKSLGMSVVAEGVEQERTFAELRCLGCDVVQGYLFARPFSPRQAYLWYTGAILNSML